MSGSSGLFPATHLEIFKEHFVGGQGQEVIPKDRFQGWVVVSMHLCKTSFSMNEAKVKCDPLDLHSERGRRDGIVPDSHIFPLFQFTAKSGV
jgi:hypothetical protein